MQNKTMKVYHRDLLDLCNKFGYPISESGLCQGFSMMAVQAFWAKDFKTFSERLDIIGHYRGYDDGFYSLIKDLNTIKRKVIQKQELTRQEQRLADLQIPAFFENLSLYHVPEQHSDLLGNKYTRTDLDIIFDIAKSSTLEDSKLSTVLNAPFAFNKTELTQFLQRLAQIIQNNPEPTPIILTSGNHAVYLSLSKNSNNQTTWDFIDISDFQRHKTSGYVRTLTTPELTDSLLVSLFSANNNEIVTNIQILSTSKPTTEKQNMEQDKKQKNNFLTLVDEFPVKDHHLNISNTYDISLMGIAYQYEHPKIVQELLKNNNFDINHEILGEMTLLHFACKRGDLQLIQQLRESKNIDVNKADKNGLTPLHFACINQQSEVITELLKTSETFETNNTNKIHINQTDINGRTALHYACILGNPEIVQKLVKKGAHLNQQCKEGNTALHYACQKGRLNIVQELAKHPEINVNHANKNGLTPLHFACGKGPLEAVQELLKSELIKVSQADRDGDTPLHFAADQPEIIQALLKHKDMDVEIVNKANKEGVTPLHFACQKGNVEAIQILLNNDANVNQATSVTKNTPLHEACLSAVQTYENENLFILLLAKGASITQKNSKGETALDIAAREESTNPAAIKVILEYAISNKIDLNKIMSRSTKSHPIVKNHINKNTISAFETFKMKISTVSIFNKKVKEPEKKPELVKPRNGNIF